MSERDDPSADGERRTSDGQVLRLKLGWEAVAPGQARRSVTSWLSSAGYADDVVEAMGVVTSELVTNAIVHARSAPELAMMLDDRRMIVEVHDTESAPPVVRPNHRDRGVGGYGLRLVEALADRWGWEPTQSGKRVWVETRFVGRETG